MGKIWFTSDTHFGHKNILQYDNRPFSTIDEHDLKIIENHNEVVGDDDDIYHLGDVAFSASKLEFYLKNAKGRIHLIRGNHDDRLAWKHAGFASKQEALYLRREKVYLSHYSHRVWRRSNHGSAHFFGHTHGLLAPVGRSLDVGVMCHNYKPISLDEAMALVDARDSREVIVPKDLFLSTIDAIEEAVLASKPDSTRSLFQTHYKGQRVLPQLKKVLND